MNTEPRQADRERIENEAAVWAARLRGGGMTDADRTRLTGWLEQDSEHQFVLSRYRELASDLDHQLGTPGQGAILDNTIARRRRWRTATIAFAAAAAVAVLFFVLGGRPREFATHTAERHVATLDDGSRIELNAQTQLAVAFTRHERHVRLTRGEAFFTVAKDANRPFVVTTPAGKVRVTGTVFNVRAARTERVEVTVLEGHVQVRPDAAPESAALAAGEQAILAHDRVDVNTLAETAVQDAVAWRQGLAHFEDTPLQDVIDRFAAYHARTITVAPGVADMRLGGRYSLDDLNGALETIERVLPVRVEREAGGAVRIVAAGSR
ncbi:MAG TPA: FecR domain-containing protein [Opitutaceae bacterium]|nr:FecR domain-containing protein [Opitutaceae bacterium]